MKKNSKSKRFASVVIAAALTTASLVSEPAHAYEPPTPGVGACFGVGASPYFADVIPAIAGNELVVMTVVETVEADADTDGFRQVFGTARVKVVDRLGNVVWTSPPLRLRGPDTATVAADTYFMSGFGSETFAASLFIGGPTCYGSAFAIEAGGQDYLAVMIGFMSQTGADPDTGEDESKINIWILDPASGAIVFVHALRPRLNRYLMGISLTGAGLVDGDANDELVVAYARPTGNGNHTINVDTLNILTGALEDRFVTTMRNTRIFE